MLRVWLISISSNETKKGALSAFFKAFNCAYDKLGDQAAVLGS